MADPYTPTPNATNNRTRLIRTIAEGIEALDPDGHGMTAATIVSKLTDSAWSDTEAVRDAKDAMSEIMEKMSAVALGKILANERNHNLGGIKIVERDDRDRSNIAKWRVVRVSDPPPATKTADESPASPADNCTQESSLAGDAGDKNGGPASAEGVPNKRTGERQTDQGGGGNGRTGKRSGRVSSNQHRGTPLDKGGSA